MKSYLVRSGVGIEALEFVDLPEPKPGPGEVLIKVRANSLNYREFLILNGGYARNDKRPVIPASDGAGEVLEVGAGVTRFAPGDRVVGAFFQKWLSGRMTEEGLRSALGGGIDGMLAEYVVLHESGLVPVPGHLSYAEAATLPCAGVTAWQALISLGHTKAGDTVLILGTGGVAIAALQIAKAQGARVIITSKSDEKLERARRLGADDTINYAAIPEWEKEALRLTGGLGIDHVIEVGGPDTLNRSILSTRPGGTLSLIGVLTGFEGHVATVVAIINQLRIQGVYVGNREMLEDLIRALEVGGIRPVIDRTFAFTDTVEALRYAQSMQHFGKVVISHD